MVDRAKDIEFRLQDRRKRLMQGHINSVDDDLDGELQEIHCELEEAYVDLDAGLDIEACMVEVSLESNESESCKFCETPTISIPCLSPQLAFASVVELNLVHTPESTAVWYLDSGATHYIAGNQQVFSSLHQTWTQGRILPFKMYVTILFGSRLCNRNMTPSCEMRHENLLTCLLARKQSRRAGYTRSNLVSLDSHHNTRPNS